MKFICTRMMLLNTFRCNQIVIRIPFFIAMLFFTSLKGQSVEFYDSNKRVTIQDTNTTYNIKFTLRSKRPNQLVDKIDFTPVSQLGDAIPSVDYTLTGNMFTHFTGYTDSFQIITFGRVTAKKKLVHLRIGITTDDTTYYQIEMVSLVPPAAAVPPAPPPVVTEKCKCSSDTENRTISIVTGSNFDFFGNSIFKNYAGELKVTMPNLWIKHRLGLIVGLSTFQYYTADSSNGSTYLENVLIDRSSRQFIYDTTKFLRQVYSLNSKTNITLSGGFAELIYRLNCANEDAKVYATAYVDYLATTTTTHYIKNVLFNDTLTYRRGDERQVFSTYGGIRPTEIVKRRIDGYLGLGITTIVSKSNAFNLFGQVIFGGTTLKPSLNSTTVRDETATTPKIISQQVTNSLGGFYLVKCSVTEKVTRLNGTVGIEIRGLFPAYAPFVGAYLGFKIDLEKFFK